MGSLNLKGYTTNDTIAAIATFPSSSALGVIKISGTNALEILARIFLPKTRKNIKKAKTYSLHYGWIVNRPKSIPAACVAFPGKAEGSRLQKGKNKEMIDEVLVSVMRAPHTYTRENVVEISSHGGAFVLNSILERILACGARLAFPGEFTYRAMIHGRINLLQAQSITSIIDAKSDKGLQSALVQLQDDTSALDGLRHGLKELFAEVEASLHFPEDHIVQAPGEIKERLRVLEQDVQGCIDASREGSVLQEGLRCVICGKTNVGKSTLFNLLLKKERVIVSRFAGTTRDVVEELICIKGVPLRLYDTAGILTPKDAIERKAAQKTDRAFKDADLVLLVFDNSKLFSRDDKVLLAQLKIRENNQNSRQNIIIIINKIDLAPKLKRKTLEDLGYRIVEVSAVKDKGIKELEDAIVKSIYSKDITRHDVIFLSSYQRHILEDTLSLLKESRTYIEQGYTIDVVNPLLKECVDNIGKLTGEIFSEEVLESIFSKFCIGK